MCTRYRDCERDRLGMVLGDKFRYDLTLKELPILSGTCLDIGELNPFTSILSRIYTMSLESSNTDLDVEPLEYDSDSFDFVFSFEVVEHLMNPLFHLIECSRVLKPNGTLILTVPVPLYPPSLMWYKGHFHEIDKIRLQDLLSRSGLSIRKYKVLGKGYMIQWLMRGLFRPLLRSVFGGWQYVECSK